MNQMKNNNPPNIMIVGDYPNQMYEKMFLEYQPYNCRNTEFLNINTKQGLEQILVTFNLYGGREEYDWYDNLHFSHQNYFIVCFNALFPSSIYILEERWFPQIKKYAPKAPIILLGIHHQQNGSNYEKDVPLSQKEGNLLSKKLGSVCYIEMREDLSGIKTLFDILKNLIIKEDVETKNVQKTSCGLL